MAQPETLNNRINQDQTLIPGPSNFNVTERNAEVARVSLKIPNFWRSDPIIWFAQVESQFRIAHITRDQTRYDYVIGSMDSETLAYVSDIVTDPPLENKYEVLKQRLLSAFSDSETTRLQKVLTELELGDDKPSQLLVRMRHNSSGKIDDSLLRTLWLQRLPVEMRTILSTSSDNLDRLQIMADKIWEFQKPNFSTTSVSSINQK